MSNLRKNDAKTTQKFNPSQAFEFDEVHLHRSRILARVSISREMMARSSRHEFEDHISRTLVRQLEVEVLHEQHDPVTISVTRPETWLDSVLDRFCPEWLMDQFDWLRPGFITEEATVDPKTYYPKLDPEEYGLGVVRFMVATRKTSSGS